MSEFVFLVIIEHNENSTIHFRLSQKALHLRLQSLFQLDKYIKLKHKNIIRHKSIIILVSSSPVVLEFNLAISIL